MDMRKLYWITFFLWLCNQAFATTGDSLHFLIPQDTINLKIDRYGEKYFYHTLETGQTLFGVTRFYGLRLDDVISLDKK
jgi:hypothetical protein